MLSRRSNAVYLDCNATTPVHPDAAKAALETMQSLYGNPSSPHLTGLQAKYILENTRTLAAQLLSVDPDQITFTSGATESIQTAVFSVLQSLKGHSTPKTKILVGAVEHKAVPEAIHHWVKMLNLPLQIVTLPVDSKGQIRLDILENELENTALLCTMAVNNETGVIQDLKAIEKILNQKQSQAFWLVDCVQALGKQPLSFKSSRISYATFSGHKVYAPKGVGFLYAAKNTPFYPLIVGGGQEKGHRSGTENLPGIAAMGAILEKLLKEQAQRDGLDQHNQILTSYRAKLIEELERAFPKIQFNTPFDCSVPTTIHFSIPGLSSAELLDLFDSAGIRLSAGSACNSTSAKPSHVLEAMGLPLDRCISAVRLSFGLHTSKEEIEAGCKLIQECASALKNTCLLETAKAFDPPSNLRDGIVQLRSGPSNTWLIVHKETKRCIIIDPCDTVAERIEKYVQCQKLEIEAILDTHSHADHESIRPELQRVLAAHMVNSHAKFDHLGWPEKGNLTEVTLQNGEKIPALVIVKTDRSADGEVKGDLVLGKLYTPGHTSDSHAFLYGWAKDGLLKNENIQFAFSGDTVLNGGLGRTNFSTSDTRALFESLRLLNGTLSPHSLLCPAHDYNNSFATTFDTEIKENPLLALATGPMTPMTLDSFLTKKQDIDTKLAAIEADFQTVVCGVTGQSTKCQQEKVSLSADEFKQQLQKRMDNWTIIDVREPQEHSLSGNWSTLGLKDSPRNVPLSRFVNFMKEVLSGDERDNRAEPKNLTKILLICRSGTRSLMATRSLRRLGVDQVWNLDGGLVKLQ